MHSIGPVTLLFALPIRTSEYVGSNTPFIFFDLQYVVHASFCVGTFLNK
jgi:hypothetical protein